MTHDHDEIIVFGQFDSVIEANLVKSKLDAYGIPCFLTEENMATLYQQSFGIRVRLHLFSRDRDRAASIMLESQSNEVDHDQISCPKCQSTELEREFPRSLSEDLAGSLKVMFFGVFMPEKKIFRCLRCDHEF